MAFATKRGSASRKVWDRIPTDTDVLITHGPPHSVLDQVETWGSHHGCVDLTNAVLRLKPQAHIFGHIHGGWGKEMNRHRTQFLNCSVMNAKRVLTHRPLLTMATPIKADQE